MRTGVPDLEVLQCRVAGILEVMSKRRRDVADVASFVVERDRVARRCEERHAAGTLNEVAPLILRGVPLERKRIRYSSLRQSRTHVKLAHRVGLNGDLGDSNLLGDLEVARVGDLDRAPWILFRDDVREVESERLGSLPEGACWGILVSRRSWGRSAISHE